MADLFYHANKFYILDSSQRKVYRYNTDFGYEDAISLHALSSDPSGITFSGGSFYILNKGQSRAVCEYSSDFSGTPGIISLVSSNTGPTAITVHEGEFYITDTDKNQIFVYSNSNGTFSNSNGTFSLKLRTTFDLYSDNKNIFANFNPKAVMSYSNNGFQSLYVSDAYNLLYRYNTNDLVELVVGGSFNNIPLTTVFNNLFNNNTNNGNLTSLTISNIKRYNLTNGNIETISLDVAAGTNNNGMTPYIINEDQQSYVDNVANRGNKGLELSLDIGAYGATNKISATNHLADLNNDATLGIANFSYAEAVKNISIFYKYRASDGSLSSAIPLTESRLKDNVVINGTIYRKGDALRIDPVTSPSKELTIQGFSNTIQLQCWEQMFHPGLHVHANNGNLPLRRYNQTGSAAFPHSSHWQMVTTETKDGYSGRMLNSPTKPSGGFPSADTHNIVYPKSYTNAELFLTFYMPEADNANSGLFYYLRPNPGAGRQVAWLGGPEIAIDSYRGGGLNTKPTSGNCRGTTATVGGYSGGSAGRRTVALGAIYNMYATLFDNAATPRSGSRNKITFGRWITIRVLLSGGRVRIWLYSQEDAQMKAGLLAQDFQMGTTDYINRLKTTIFYKEDAGCTAGWAGFTGQQVDNFGETAYGYFGVQTYHKNQPIWIREMRARMIKE